MVEIELLAGQLDCPDCGLPLCPWGFARERDLRGDGGVIEKRRPRRAICSSSRQTHVLLADDSLSRRRDTVQVIGRALVAKAAGSGRRSIAAALGLHPSTVAGWFRRFTEMAVGIRQHFTRWASVLGPGHGPMTSHGSPFSDALEAIGVAGIVAVRRFGPLSVWSLASVLSGGRLLATRARP